MMKKTKRATKPVTKKSSSAAKTRRLSDELLKEIIGGQLGVCQSRCSICQSHCGAQSHCTP
jgi:hypothetical protein